MKNAHNWSTPVFLLLAAVVALYVLKSRPTPEIEGPNALPFADIDTTKTHRISIRSKNGAFVLVRKDVTFRIEGSEAPIDVSIMDGFLRTLSTAKASRSLSERPAEFGTTVAQGTIQSSVAIDYELGGPAPTPPSAHYLRVGSRYFVVTDLVVRELSRTKNDFQDRAVVPSIFSTWGELVFVEDGKSRTWTMPRPSVIHHDGKRVSEGSRLRILQGLADLRWERFEDTSFTQLGSIRMQRDAQTFVLKFGGACDGEPNWRHAIRESAPKLAGCVSASTILALEKESDPDPRLFAAKPDEITEIRLGKYDVARKDASYVMRAPTEKSLSDTEGKVVERYLARLLLLGSKAHFPSAIVAPNSSPFAAVIAIAGDREEKVTFFRNGENIFAKRADDQVAFELPGNLLPAIVPRDDWLESVHIWESDRDPESIVLDCGQKQALVRRGNEWTSTFPVEQGRVLDLIDRVKHAQFEPWDAPTKISNRPNGDETRCTIEWADSGSRITLALPRDSGSPIELMDGKKRSYVLTPESLRSYVEPLYVERAPLRGSDTQEIVSWKVGGKDHPLTRESSDILGSFLATFRADEALHLGGPLPHEGFDSPNAQLTFRPQDAGATRTFLVGRDKDGVSFVRITPVNATFVVSTTKIRTLFPQ